MTWKERAKATSKLYPRNAAPGTTLRLQCNDECGSWFDYLAIEGGWNLDRWSRVDTKCRGCMSPPTRFDYGTLAGEAVGCPRPIYDFIRAGLAPRFHPEKPWPKTK